MFIYIYWKKNYKSIYNVIYIVLLSLHFQDTNLFPYDDDFIRLH